MAKKAITSKVRRLRNEMTEAEAILWGRLRNNQLGAKVVRQFPIGPFIADFACRRLKLVIELDGGEHALRTAANAVRSQVIEAHGYRVIRFWNNDILENIEGVLTAIVREMEIAGAE